MMEILEAGAVTTPKLVVRIAQEYGLTDLEAEELMPLHMRPHGGDYEPDRYVIKTPVNKTFVAGATGERFSAKELRVWPEK